jgi:hypothetical protein
MRILALSVAVVLPGIACQQQVDTADRTSKALTEGDTAPRFELESPSGAVSLADYQGKKPVLLYFSMGPG